MSKITEIAKNMHISHNVTFRVIDLGTNKVVKEYAGHNQATNSMITGVGHYLAGDGIMNQAKALLDSYVPKYISLGTMGLINQDEDTDGLPLGISGDGADPTDEVARFTSYMNQAPGYGADGYDSLQNNGRSDFGLGPVYTSGAAVGCELINGSFPRVRITHREVIPETNAETPETVDVVLSGMISTGALSQFRGGNNYVFITVAGLWSTSKYSSTGNGLLAGYRIKPPNQANWDMNKAENRHILQENVIRVGVNQVVQVIWKIQIGSIKKLTDQNTDYGPTLASVLARTVQSIVIPDNTTKIGDYAFYNCDDLQMVQIPLSVSEIGYNAFFGCNSLQTISIPSSVQTISSYAFQQCTGLTDIYVDAPESSISGAPWGAPNSPTVHWRES